MRKVTIPATVMVLKKIITPSTLLLILFFGFDFSYAEIIDGPANIRAKPNGEILLSLREGEVNVISSEGDWFLIKFNVYVNKNVIEKNKLKKDVVLYDEYGDEIGKTFCQVQIETIHQQEEDGEVLITILGHTFKSNFQKTIEPKTLRVKKLIIEEYDLNMDSRNFLDSADGYRLPLKIALKRKAWRKWEAKNHPLENLNEQLKSLGYIFRKKSVNYDLFQKNRLVLSGLQRPHGLSINSNKTRFIFAADFRKPDGNYGGHLVFLDGKSTDLPVLHGHAPFFLQEKIMLLESVETSTTQNKYEYASIELSREVVEIYLDGKVIFKLNFIPYPFDRAIQEFYGKDENWIFEYMKAETNGNKVDEYYGNVIINGINLNEQEKVKEIFNYIYIKDKPFYFFKDYSGSTKINYSGIVAGLKYDEILHYKCCSYSAFNPKWNKNMIGFFGIKAGKAYYVEAGVYE